MKRLRRAMLILSIFLVGGSYAYWSQELQIVNNITTGEIKFDANIKIKSKSDYMNVVTLKNNKEDIDSNQQLNISNAYPGSKVIFNIEIIDESTFPVKFEILKNDTEIMGEVNESFKLIKVGNNEREDSNLSYNLDEINEKLTHIVKREDYKQARSILIEINLEFYEREKIIPEETEMKMNYYIRAIQDTKIDDEIKRKL